MIFIHPKTKNTFVGVEGSPLIAEIEAKNEDGFESVMIGNIGVSGGLMLYIDEWNGFMELVNEINTHIQSMKE